jgi:hypothetical protein
MVFNLSRRSMALGAPAMLLLSACGGGGGDGVGASAPVKTDVNTGSEAESSATQAKFAVQDVVLLDVRAFSNFFLEKFSPSLKRVSLSRLISSATRYKKLNPSFDQPSGAELTSSQDIFVKTFQALPQDYKDSIIEDIRDDLSSKARLGSIFSDADYTFNEYINNKDNIMALSDNAMMAVKQGLPLTWGAIGVFIRTSLTAADYTAFLAREKALEALNDSRRLSGLDDDFPYVDGNKNLRVALGFKKHHVERPELKKRDWSIASVFFNGHDKYENDSMVLKGSAIASYEPSYHNATRNQSMANQSHVSINVTDINYTMFHIDNDTTTFVNNITVADNATNGNFTGLDKNESITLLRNITYAMVREVGQEWESYVAASYIFRALNQAFIGVTRLGLAFKKINVAAIQTELTSAMNDPMAH